ncbi:YggS family pyridoxal phosphate-dependent enzyme [Haoranjiania flava]|uniref:Pyridoxal phosphate homeostasis protein n=1 Tax=Haoranjiania flava TaxID=1856322 RepID=A0AAE3INB2_9BACT|nr:YggS family pyridoxal phosphate-dependent enzyme [Haoranjiania flava]MCU7694235.1 YggS family pyridoxal phosphate-dependent enzyme [Haoranjiania flava]
MHPIIENINLIKQRIANACAGCGRRAEDVKLLLATKTVNAEKIRIAFSAGETLMGENKVQELKEKYEDLKSIPHQTHFIGHLQTNKIKEVLKYVNCIQSVDRIELARKLNDRLAFEQRTMEIFIQVNTSYEDSKFGIAPEQAVDFAQEVSRLERLQIKGLMTIGLFSAEQEKVRKCFELLKTLQHEMLDKGIEAHELSMGMSHDLETAIEEGATIVRVGTAIFGERIYPDSYYWNEK